MRTRIHVDPGRTSRRLQLLVIGGHETTFRTCVATRVCEPDAERNGPDSGVWRVFVFAVQEPSLFHDDLFAVIATRNGDDREAALVYPSIHRRTHRLARLFLQGIPEVGCLRVGVLMLRQIASDAIAEPLGAEVLFQHPKH